MSEELGNTMTEMARQLWTLTLSETASDSTLTTMQFFGLGTLILFMFLITTLVKSNSLFGQAIRKSILGDAVVRLGDNLNDVTRRIFNGVAKATSRYESIDLAKRSINYRTARR
ncbi:uncharacterized protein LOC122249135 [Penaeus japonicus]|uniref:uncharacterized protein LOC122249135 n=1 Tax=Penaeus japonicus TaxID=27405 RepID=UPI001C70E7A4|nr:uncharacterized protein LOC122249135 [Penaeus japonicus]